MMMALRWRMPPPPIVLQWRGEQAGTAAYVAANQSPPIAAVIGPPGPPGPSFDLSAAVIDGGTFN
jgi:hypothetical protein